MALGQEPIAVKVAPGVATTLKRNPAGLRESFAVRASAGQTLLVELNIGEPKSGTGEEKIQVYGPGGAEVESGLGAGTYSTWMDMLPRSGTYRVTLLLVMKEPYVLRFSLMEPHDPRLDVGINGSRISIPLLGKEMTWKREEFFPVIQDLAEVGPDHLVASVGDVWVFVMSVEGVKRTWWVADEGARRVARLEAALKSSVVTGSPQELPGGANDHAALVFFACKKVIEGPGLRAVRWIGSYDQTDSGPMNPMAYAADGISRDGRYFVMIRGDVSHPAVPKPTDSFDPDRIKDLREKLARKLDAAPETSFTPGLDKLDKIVRSFSIY
jgi:hypothetical protein